MTDLWREGARVYDASDKCPACPDGGLIAFASDFKLMGKHSIRVCAKCCKTYDNGNEKGPVTINPAPRDA